MTALSFAYGNTTYSFFPDTGTDLSIPLVSGPEAVNCFWAPPIEYSPVIAGSFTGDTAQGGVVNFFNVKINPHGNGTHTECVGHIARERYYLNDCLRQYLFFAKLVSLYPVRTDEGDRVLMREQLEEVFKPGEAEALLIRTLPNSVDKTRRNYSGTNPPYMDYRAAAYLAESGLEHLLLDLPSVDREEDGGKLLAHKAFWQYPEAPRMQATITELIYVPDNVADGFYCLNLQTIPLVLDASPSRPVLYSLEH